MHAWQMQLSAVTVMALLSVLRRSGELLSHSHMLSGRVQDPNQTLKESAGRSESVSGSPEEPRNKDQESQGIPNPVEATTYCREH